MVENLIAGVVLIAFGGVGAWQTSPEAIGMLSSLTLVAWGASRVLNAVCA